MELEDSYSSRDNLVLNIFEIWEDKGKILPFAVRKFTWNHVFYVIIEKIECKKLPYGKAFGYPTIDGRYTNHFEHDKAWRLEKRIPCDGCYKWVYAPQADFETYKQGVQATIKTVKEAYVINSQFRFGQFKDKFVLDVFYQHPNYIQWAIINLEKFFLTHEAFNYLNSIFTYFKFNDVAVKINDRKILERLDEV